MCFGVQKDKQTNKEKKYNGCRQRDTHRGAAPESSSGRWGDRNDRRHKKTKLAESDALFWHGCKHANANANPGLHVRAGGNNEIMATSDMDCSMPVYCKSDDAL